MIVIVENLHKKHLREIEEMEKCLRFPMSSEILNEIIADENCNGHCILDKGSLVGYVLFCEIASNLLDIISINVKESYRRKKIGSSMIWYLQNKYDLRINVWEGDLGTHLFLKNLGFRAVDIEDGLFGEDDSSYVFEWRHKIIIT